MFFMSTEKQKGEMRIDKNKIESTMSIIINQSGAFLSGTLANSSATLLGSFVRTLLISRSITVSARLLGRLLPLTNADRT